MDGWTDGRMDSMDSMDSMDLMDARGEG
ncbi:MAG: hypothetical protein RL153_236, partial [Verrucomicrobiota bacterium]